MKLAVVILNWNHADQTVECVRRVQAWGEPSPAVWVVDNASAHDEAKTIADRCAGIRVIRSPANRGFAGGHNLGMESALQEGAEAVLLLSKDAAISQSHVARLLQDLQDDPTIGAIGPVVRERDGRREFAYAGGRNIALHLRTRIPLDRHRRPATGQDPVRLVSHVPGCMVLLRAAALRVTGLLDEDYFFSGEIADLCTRLRGQGYRSAVDLSAEGTHEIDSDSPVRDSLYRYYSLRNRFLYIRKHHRRRLWLNGFWFCAGLLMEIQAAAERKSPRLKAIRQAVADGLGGRFGGRNEIFLS